jgi:transposase|tara:strand:+ start:11 stop:154 length:144 start_codon:yes stop_codon:yes gene_type:complete
MITTKPKEIKKEFDSKYNSPAMKLHLEEQGWKYIGNNNDNPIYQLIY